MSVINRMLQDLDRRHALGTASEESVVRASGSKRGGGREWFWRTLVVLLAAVLAWVGWVAVQLLPKRPLVTELAFQAAAEAQSRAALRPAPTPITLEEPKPEPTPVPSEPLRLAMQLETPVQERTAQPAKPVSVKPKPKPSPLQPVAAAAPAEVSVDKRASPPTNSAEQHFRRAALLLNHGRVSEAEGELAAALRADPSHTAARQAYVALLLEQQRIGVAHRVLQEGLALNPEQPAFAVALARIYAGQRDYGAALEVLDRAGPATANADFQAMRGAVLQRMGRHGEAVEAYQAALRGQSQPATSWIGLGISLEGLGRRSDAAAAYRRALTAGPLAVEARDYAESRAKALE